ncbi:MAG: hypothetical protein HY730_06875 [Candidatus Tectomicrobia bacterium]|uniref:Peptidase M3A/M3B catalytic domain-containing protein n=1 Tax=Tectimicrobiota bacterium TaxID=2528274 RepID=A0A933LR75_UNCTE|nr:hypothetical protein [Candidatus Tectomicrobia bacterium]
MDMTLSLRYYVSLSFTGYLRDVSSIAHEFGHGLHFILAGCQSVVNYLTTCWFLAAKSDNTRIPEMEANLFLCRLKAC